MTHFLGRLVERARGTAPRIQPIVAPKFASAPITEIATEVEATPVVPQEASAKSAIPERTNGAVVRQKERAVEKPKEELVEATVPAEPEALLVPVQRPQDDLSQPPTSTRESETLRRDVLPQVQPATLPVVRRASHQVRSASPRSSSRGAVSADPLTSRNEPASDERSIVRVTIGRIEVRAEPPPASPSRKAVPRSQPKLTLDAYLKSRKEGAR